MQAEASRGKGFTLSLLIATLSLLPVNTIAHPPSETFGVPSPGPFRPPDAVVQSGRQLLADATFSLSHGGGPASRMPWACPAIGLRLLAVDCRPAPVDGPPAVSNPRGTASWSELGRFQGRDAGGIAYDAADGYVVMFGGVPDDASTWKYSGGVWTNLTATIGTSPPPRVGAAMTYDGADGYVLLFGGTPPFGGPLLNDTWTFVGGAWANITASAGPAPPPRVYAGMTYDATAKKVLAFGGQFLRGFARDTWEFSAGRWANLTSNLTSSPGGNFMPALAYDPKDGYDVLAGTSGGRGLLDEYNATWTFSGGQWKNVTTTAGRAPLARAYSDAFTGPGSSGMYLFGGLASGYLPPGTYEQFDDLWSFSGGVWARVTTAGTGPAARELARLVFDPHDNLTLLYGGLDFLNASYLGDTWTFSNGSWSLAASSSTPDPRTLASMVYDPALPGVLLFGGSGFNDTWTYRAGNWSLLHPATSPPGRLGAALAYDAADSEVVLFGGFVLPARASIFGFNHVYLNDTWTWSGTYWTNVTDRAHAPSARARAQMVYDSTDGRVVLFGGAWRLTTAPADTWEFHAGRWTNITTWSTVSPPARLSGAFSDDPPDHGALMYGGSGAPCPPTLATCVENETWLFRAGNWTQVTIAANPGRLQDAALAYDPANGNVVLFAGLMSRCWSTPNSTGCTWVTSNETWSYRSGQWTNLTPIIGPAPSPRVEANRVTDSVDGTMFLFGGVPYGGSPGLADWWTLSLGTGTGPSTTAPTASADPVAIGGLTVLTEAASGGSPPYSLSWHNLPPGCMSQNATSLDCVPALEGTFTVSTTVTDSAGHSNVSSGLLLLVVSSSEALALVRITASASWVDAGSALRLAAEGFDGAGDALPSATFGWSVSPSARGMLNSSQGNDVVLTGGPLSGPVTVFVNGTYGGVTKGNTTRIAVEPSGATPLTLLGFAASPPEIPAGTSVLLSAGYSGGQSPYVFAYRGLPPGCAGVDANSTICSPIVQPTSPVTYTVTLTLSDVNGASTTAQTNVTVLPVPASQSAASPAPFPTWFPWLLAGLGLAAVAGGVLWFRRRKSGPPPVDRPWD